jgi:hypothetical protein
MMRSGQVDGTRPMTKGRYTCTQDDNHSNDEPIDTNEVYHSDRSTLTMMIHLKTNEHRKNLSSSRHTDEHRTDPIELSGSTAHIDKTVRVRVECYFNMNIICST